MCRAHDRRPETHLRLEPLVVPPGQGDDSASRVAPVRPLHPRRCRIEEPLVHVRWWRLVLQLLVYLNELLYDVWVVLMLLIGVTLIVAVLLTVLDISSCRIYSVPLVFMTVTLSHIDSE